MISCRPPALAGSLCVPRDAETDDLMPFVLGRPQSTPPQVIAEHNEGVARVLMPETNWDWLHVVSCEVGDEALRQDYS